LDSKRLALLLSAALASGAAQVQSASPPAPLLSPLPVLVALKAAKAALVACTAEGLPATVTVTDRDGVARVILVGDGAGATGTITSRRKAYTAAALGISTAQLAKNIIKLKIVPESVDPELIAFPGGIPIRRHDAVIGAIGVGGADRGISVDRNEACAQAGLDSIKDQLD
jgi:uncharacterized protein GlcG (DUF336 family)